VELETVNVNVPNEVRFYFLENPVFVRAGSQTGATVEIEVPPGTPAGKYRFQVVARSGTEKHTAAFDLVITGSD